ncbi:MAG: hypothetical protein ACREGH_03820 [Minisyncoccia bacterium]
MLWGFFISKASHRRIGDILKKEGFVYSDRDVASLLQGNQKGVRYGNTVLPRNEGGAQQKRFIKIVLDGKWKTYRLFKRQVKITAALHDDKKYTFPTMAVIRYSLMPPVPYAIFETREDGDGFGFMHDSPAFYERFTEADMQQLVGVMYAFHRAGFTVEASTLKLTRPLSSKISFYKIEFEELLDTKITHKTKEGQEMTKSVEELLVSYTGMEDIRLRIMQMLERCFTEVEASKTSKGFYLVHADMQIDNVYKHTNGDFELLDFEWVGRADNPVIAILFDYGNLRARAWSSPSFQQMLDKIMFEEGAKIYPNSAEMIRSALTLGSLRSSLMMSRFHLDVINTVKKDKRTEENYHAMYPKTVAALKQVLKS